VNGSTWAPHLVRNTQFNDVMTTVDKMAMMERIQKWATEPLVRAPQRSWFFGHQEILGRGGAAPQRAMTDTTEPGLKDLRALIETICASQERIGQVPVRRPASQPATSLHRSTSIRRRGTRGPDSGPLDPTQHEPLSTRGVVGNQMKPEMTIERHIPAIAMQHDLSATLVGTTEKLVKEAAAESFPGGHRSQEVDTPPAVGGWWQSGRQCQLGLI